MIYIIVFFACFIADIAHKQSKGLYLLFVTFIVVILCFGYTCGSDWRNYEILYYNSAELERYSSSEFGFVYIVKFFKLFIDDFWIFNAIMKFWFLMSLKSFFSFFSKKPWSCIGLSFAFKTLFLIIDCPMRFMMGMTIFLYSIKYFFKKEWIKFGVIVFISMLFHNAMIINAAFLCLLLFSRTIANIKTKYIVVICFLSIIISLVPSFYQLIFDKILSVITDSTDDNRLLFYAIFNSGTAITFATVWQFILLMVFVINKKIILEYKYGASIYAASILFFCLTIIINPLPTSFRLTICLGYFYVVSIIILISKWMSIKELTVNIRKVSFFGATCIVTWLMLIVLKDTYSLPAYYPYTNSIPYIVFGHEPYAYRYQYNYKEYFRTFGKLPQKNNDGQNLNNQ